jgi:hypothetical protein
MSKKSRRRNKKILAALALAGGAAMFGRRKKNALGDTGSLSGKAGSEGMDYLAPTKKPVVLKQNKPKLFAKNTTANPNAIPHKEIFNAVHGNAISGGPFNKDPEWINVKKKIEVLKNSGAPKNVIRNELMEYVTNLNNQNYAIKQKALNNARTDYSASNPAVKTRLEDAKKMEMLRAIRAPLNPLNSANTIMSTEAAQPIQSGYIGAYGAARGGRITLKSGGRVRGVGIAKRGFSKSLRKNKVDNN